MADSDETEERAHDAGAESEHEHAERDERDGSFRRLGDSLISSIWGDSSAAIKRGQGVVAGVAQGTKEELVRMVSQEVRGFLDKMDAADLVQEIVSGLVIEMKTEIRFKRDESGRVEPDIRTSETRVGSEAVAAEPAEDEDEGTAGAGKAAGSGKPAGTGKPAAAGAGKPAGTGKPAGARSKLFRSNSDAKKTEES